MKRRLLVLSLLWLTSLPLWGLFLWPAPATAQGDFPDLCADNPGNLVRNCGFDQGMSEWTTFLEAGSPGFSVEGSWPACDSPKCPALRVSAQDWFVGGIYQQVGGVTPGATYWADVVWMVYNPAGKTDNTVGRRIGIDPSGGTDPRSPNIVWSQNVWQSFSNCPYKICRELQVQATAQNSTITLFVRIEDTWKNRRGEFSTVPESFFQESEAFWIDDVGLVAVGGAAAAPAPTSTPQPPTETPEPPSPTPKPTARPRPPTETPVPAEQLTATAQAASPLPTPTPSLSPTATGPAVAALPTLTPAPTPEPSATPTRPRPTRTPRPRPTRTPVPGAWFDIGLAELIGGGVVCLAGLGLIGILVIIGVLWFLYRTGASAIRQEGEPPGDGPAGESSPASRETPKPGAEKTPPGDEAADAGSPGDGESARTLDEGEK